jgi:hypothetical protein
LRWYAVPLKRVGCGPVTLHWSTRCSWVQSDCATGSVEECSDLAIWFRHDISVGNFQRAKHECSSQRVGTRAKEKCGGAYQSWQDRVAMLRGSQLGIADWSWAVPGSIVSSGQLQKMLLTERHCL